MALEQEMETYRRKLPKLLETPGKYVLIKGKRILGIYDTDEAALDAGAQLLGPRVAFLAKKIEAVEKPIRVPLPAWAFENANHQAPARRKRRPELRAQPSRRTTTTLEQEMITYRQKLPGLLRALGKHVLIKGRRVLGIFDDRDSALDAAYRRLGPRVAFLVKEIVAVEKPIPVRLPAWAFENVAHQAPTDRKRRRRKSPRRSKLTRS